MIVKLKSRIVRMTLGRVIMHFIINNWFIDTTKYDLMIYSLFCRLYFLIKIIINIPKFSLLHHKKHKKK